MESPSARAANSAMLLHHLDAMPPGGGVHRRRVSRTPQLQTEDVFYSPRNAPHSPKATLDPHQSPNRSGWSRSASPRFAHMEPEQFNKGGALQANRSTEASANPPLTYRQQGYQQYVSGATASQLDTPPAPFPPSSSPRAPREGRRRCAKCEREISGHFVRALGAAYHIQCFTCDDCGVECASKFFPMNNRPLCEHCYFKRQNLLCHRCNGSLRGSYITALDHKYHVEHFTCSLCPTVFGPDDSYFEHEGNVYCRIHYAALFAYRCEGCSSPILKQFVETPRGGKNLRWHPECYMIYKFWNVKVEDTDQEEVERLRLQIASEARQPTNEEYAVAHPVQNDARAKRVLSHEDAVEGLAMRTWTTLCGFEEACGDQISELVQTAVNGEFRKAYSHCTRFVTYVDVLFRALDLLPAVKEPAEVAGSGKEAKTLCRKVVSYMSLLSKTRQLSSRDRVAGLARDLLSLASAMAHYLKVLIRFGLSRALKASGAADANANPKSRELLIQFLDSVGLYSSAELAKPVSPFSSDRCGTCGKSVEDRCNRQKSRSDRLWHATAECFSCSKCHTALDPDAATISDAGHLFCLNCSDAPAQSFVRTTRLEQYVILLHVALARLDLVLSNHKRPHSQQTALAPRQQQQQQQQQNDKGSASTPILPGQRVQVGSPVFGGSAQTSDTGPSTLERTSSILQSKHGLTLDDIRRIVATEQAHSAEQKRAKSPNARPHQSKFAQQNKRSAEGPRPGLNSYPSATVLPNGKKSPNKDHFFGRLDDSDYLWVQYIAQALMQKIAKDVLHVDFEPSELSTPPDALNAGATAPSGRPGGGQGAPGGSIWERMGKVFTGSKSYAATDALEADGVFGQPLERVTARHGVDSVLGIPETGGDYTLRIPSFVDDCVGAMRQKDMSVEGVFRKNGNIRRLREFVEKIDKFPDENGLLVDESPIQLAALLKKYLRDLPDPLLTSKLARLWIGVSRLDAERQTKIVPLLVSLLPRVNRNVLETLVHFLNWVSGFAQVEDDVGSKMDIANLATVLTPTLILSNEEATSTALLPGQVDAAEEPELSAEGNGAYPSSSDGYKHATEVVKLLIQEYTLVAQVPLDVLFYLRRMKQLKLSPRRLSIKELNELMKQ